MMSMVSEITKDVTPKFYIRKDVWANGGTFKDETLYWYAKGVQALKTKPITDPTSWWFYAGMHGFDLNLWKKYLPEECKKFELPCIDKQELFWNQCQHGTYNFLPWHRGYLLAVEMTLKVEIEKLGGPKDWALPYIDYIKRQELPPVFTETHFVDKEVGLKVENPLYMQHRYPILENWLMTGFDDFAVLLDESLELKPDRLKKLAKAKAEFDKAKKKLEEIRNETAEPEDIKKAEKDYNAALLAYEEAKKLIKPSDVQKIVADNNKNLLEVKREVEAQLKEAEKRLEVAKEVGREDEIAEAEKDLKNKEDQLRKIHYISPKKGDSFSPVDFKRLSQLLTYLMEGVEKLGGTKFVEDFRKYLTERLPLSATSALFIKNFINKDANLENGEQQIGFGGPFTDFANISWSHGAIESMPHDIVHILIGGYEDQPLEDITGFGALSIPASAGLDPIFYLHHANIDRMWDIWVKKNEVTDSAIYQRKNKDKYDYWKSGPIEGSFIMPLLKEGDVITYFDFVPENLEPKLQLEAPYVLNEFLLKDGRNNLISYQYVYENVDIEEHNDKSESDTIASNKSTNTSEVEIEAQAQSFINLFVFDGVEKPATLVESTNKGAGYEMEISLELNKKVLENSKALFSALQVAADAKSKTRQCLKSTLEELDARKKLDFKISSEFSISNSKEIKILTDEVLAKIRSIQDNTKIELNKELIDNALNLFSRKTNLLKFGANNQSEAASIRLDVPIDLIGIKSKQPSNILLARNENGELVGVTGLFGLGTASDFDQPHGGNGLNRRMLVNADFSIEQGNATKLTLQPLIPASNADEEISINTINP